MNDLVSVGNKWCQLLDGVRFYIQYEVNTLLDGIMHKCVKPQNIPKLSLVCSHAIKIFFCAERKLIHFHFAPITLCRKTFVPKIMEFELTLCQ